MPSGELKGSYIGLQRTAEARAVAAPEPEALSVPREEVQVIGGKSTSPALAELAGLYLGMTDAQITSVHNKDRAAFCADVRKLAASVLAQVEPSDA